MQGVRIPAVSKQHPPSIGLHPSEVHRQESCPNSVMSVMQEQVGRTLHRRNNQRLMSKRAARTRDRSGTRAVGAGALHELVRLGDSPEVGGRNHARSAGILLVNHGPETGCRMFNAKLVMMATRYAASRTWVHASSGVGMGVECCLGSVRCMRFFRTAAFAFVEWQPCSKQM